MVDYLPHMFILPWNFQPNNEPASDEFSLSAASIAINETDAALGQKKVSKAQKRRVNLTVIVFLWEYQRIVLDKFRVTNQLCLMQLA